MDALLRNLGHSPGKQLREVEKTDVFSTLP
jgi:hypothetical protein